MRASAIIVAAGSGTRLGFNLPKAFVDLRGKALLWYSLRAIGAVWEIEEVIVTVPSGMELRSRALVRQARETGLEIPGKITAGGADRQDSVRIALALTSAEAELVVVHDAARPLVSSATFAAVLPAAERCGGAIAAIPVTDTLKRVGDDHKIVATVGRADLWQAQTPQAFRRDLLIRAHDRAAADRITATDDADLVERLGASVAVVNGSALNFKITTAEDLHLAELIIASRADP